MSDFRFTVDTDPMARSVNGVTHHVDATTVAVTGMGAAVVAAEAAAADHVSHEVTRGFHALMVSQISQKRALAKSNMDARLLEMTYQHKALLRIKAQMQADFNRIAARYGKLFNALNEALRARVFELDYPSAKLSLNDQPLIQQRQLTQASLIPTHHIEALPASQQIAAAHAKKNAAVAISRMRDSIGHAVELRNATQEIIHPMPTGARHAHWVPVLLSENDDLNLDLVRQRLFVAGGHAADPKFRQVVEACVGEAASSFTWDKVDPATREKVRGKFAELIGKSGLTEREKKAAAGLLERAEWQAISGGAA